MSDLPLPIKSDNEERVFALASHLSVYVSFGILGPILCMVLKKDSPFLQDQAKEALNFQLTMLLISLTCVGAIVAVPLLIIMSVIAGVSAYQGNAYRYPLSIRMVK
ncbi:DUF4870 domain-containing protein [Anatilimnocola floriformis]|uniref:DUF4870 domain-containing protein n=1 Tax=Anatilimnocola floriformis TaxID=2948575 RepID=UPI0020C4CCF0|nr:DUF4870 domain-containing protein [Anatilimnocola floriformis]